MSSKSTRSKLNPSIEKETKELEMQLAKFRETMSRRPIWKHGGKKLPLKDYGRRRGFRDLQGDVDVIMSGYVPSPPSAARTWSSPTLSKPVIASAIIENSLLDGTYDAEASQASFQVALNQWRQTGTPKQSLTDVAAQADKNDLQNDLLKEDSGDASKASFQDAVNQWRNQSRGLSLETDIPASIDEEIQTQTETSPKKELEVEFEEKSYFEKLKILKLQDLGKLASLPPAEISCTVGDHHDDIDAEMKGEHNDKPNYSWDESDELALQEIFSKTEIDEDIPAPPPSPIPLNRWTLTCQDITEDEEDVIIDALSRGIMVECIPSCKLSVILG